MSGVAKQIEIVLEQVKEAVAAHIPVVYIPTDQMEIVDELLYGEQSRHGILPRVIETDGVKKLTEDFFTEVYGKSTDLTDNYSNIKSVDNSEPSILISYTTDWSSILSDVKKFVCTYYNIRKSTQTQYKHLNVIDATYRSLFIVVTPKEEQIPSVIGPYVRTVRIPALTDEEIVSLINSHLSSEKIPTDIIPQQTLNQMIVSFRGFSKLRIIQMLRLMVAQQSIDYDGIDTAAVLNIIRMSKKQMLDNSPGLSWEKTTVSGIAGLGSITKWLQDRIEIFQDPERALQQHIDIPKGILISGIPGSGKSLMAKTTATIFDMPLISLDMGALLGGIMGESEHNMIEALRKAEQMAPCVLWIDVIEKAFSGSSQGSSASDGGVGRRMFGKFLTWMQEKTAACFVFATSNDISCLPPELFRSERFDRKFYTFMPTADECASIFAANIKKQNDTYNKKLQTMPQNVRALQASQLFSLELQEPSFWLQIINECCTLDATKSELVPEKPVDKNTKESDKKNIRYVWQSSSKPKNKLLTGADISTLIREAKFMVHSAPTISSTSTVIYEASRMKDTICSILKSREFKPYGETNLKDIVKCFLKLQENEFASASGQCIIDFDNYDEDKMIYMYDPKNSPKWENKYDEVLFSTVVGAINHYAKEIKSKITY